MTERRIWVARATHHDHPSLLRNRGVRLGGSCQRGKPTTHAGTRAGLVLPTLAAAQFVMLLDSSVMNVAIATVAKDVGTTVTGIQTAITLYTLVMAMFMITGGKLGSMFGRKRVFMIGCIVYAWVADDSFPS